MSVEDSGEQPQEVLILPDDVTHEIEQQLDILFQSLPQAATHTESFRGGEVTFVDRDTITERDEALFAQDYAITFIANSLQNPESSRSTVNAILSRHNDENEPNYAIYVYERVLELLEPANYDPATEEFVAFVDTLQAEEDQDPNVQQKADTLRLKLFELAYLHYQHEGLLTETSLSLEEKAEIKASLQTQYEAARRDLTEYRDELKQCTSRNFKDTHNAFSRLKNSKAVKHDRNLLNNTPDAEIMYNNIYNGRFKTHEGVAVASAKHDAQLLTEVQQQLPFGHRAVVVSARFINPSSHDKAATLFDIRLLEDVSLNVIRQRELLENDVYLTIRGRITAEAKHDSELYDTYENNLTGLRVALRENWFFTDAGREAAVTRLAAFGINALDYDTRND